MADKPTPAADPTPGQAAGAPAADDDATLLAELEAEQGKAGAKPAKKPVAKPEPAADDDAPADDAEAVADEDDDLDGDADDDAEPSDDEDEDDDEDPDDADPDGEADPALKKRLDAVRRTEQRQRLQLERERAEIARERQELQTARGQVSEGQKRFEALRERAKYDPAGVLETLGLSTDDMEYAAQQAYARSKAAAGKAEYRAAADAAQRQRQVADKADSAEKRIAELEKKLETRDQQTAVERELDTYFDRVIRKVTDATPITAALAKRPKAARAELAVTAQRLVEKLGRMPKAAELIAAHEKREARALKLRGIKPPGAGAKPAANETDAAATPAAKPAKGKAAKSAPAADPDEIAIPSTADLVRELSAQRN